MMIIVCAYSCIEDGNDPVVGEAVFRLQRSGCHSYKQPINRDKLMHMENDDLCILSTNSFMK